MKRFIALAIAFLVIVVAVYSQNAAPAQSPPQPDDDFNVFLLVFAAIVIALMLGAALGGVIVVTGFLFATAAFVTAGIASVSILAGIYTRSLSTGFKTFLYIFCSIAGIAIGSVGLYVITRLFDLDISRNSAVLAGITGGLLGGLLMAFVISRIVTILTKYLLSRIQGRKSTTR
jgi:hypothetical protein